MKKLKSITVLIVVFIMTFSLSLTLIGCTKYDEKLVVYNWEDYIGENVIEDFQTYYKETTGKSIAVTYSKFDTNETMVTKVINGDAKVDVICPSEYAIEKLIVNDKLQKLNMDNIKNANKVMPMISEKITEVFGEITDKNGVKHDMNEYMVPYMWGTLGILYNANVVTTEDLELGWKLLWNENNNEKLNNKILMKDSIRDTFIAAMMYAKEKNMLPEEHKDKSVQDMINVVDDGMLSVLETVLKSQKDLKVLKGYEVDFGKDDMIKKAAFIDLAWSGDALYAIEEAEAKNKKAKKETDKITLDYFIPKSGSNVWFDGWVVPKGAANKGAAEVFIDFMARPDIAIRNSLEIGYTTAVAPEEIKANATALALLTESYDVTEYFEDERRYPADSQYGALGLFKDFGLNNEKAVASWERIKAHGGTSGSSVWLIVGIIAGVIVVGGGAFFVITNSKTNNKKKKKITKSN